jgi:hypothetical protein
MATAAPHAPATVPAAKVGPVEQRDLPEAPPSPITGSGEAAASGRGYVFPVSERNLERWRDWWRCSA